MEIEPAVELTRVWPVGAKPGGEWAAEVEATEPEPVGVPIHEHLYDGFVEPRGKLVRERRLRRVAGVAMLAGALGTVGGVVAMNSPRGHHVAERHPGSLVAATRSSRAVRSSAISDSAATAPPSSTVARPSRLPRSRSRVAQAGRRFGGGSRPRRSKHPLAGLPASPRGGAAVVVDYLPRSSSGEATAADGPAAGSTTTGSASESPDPGTPAPSVTTRSESESESGSGRRVEFGFEH